MQKFQDFFYNLFIENGVSADSAEYLNMLALLAILFLFVFIADVITKRVLMRAFKSLAAASKTKFDDMLLANKTPNLVAHLVPLFIVIELFPVVF